MNLGKISSFLSIASLLFAFFGLLKLYLFYHYFGIDILYFVNFTDLVNASLEGIFIGYLFLFVPIIILSFLQKKKIRAEASLWLTFKSQPVLWVALLLIYIIFFYSWSQYYKHFIFTWQLKVVLLFSGVSPIFISYAIDKLFLLFRFSPLNLSNKIAISSILFIGLFYISTAYKDIKIVTNLEYHRYTHVYLKDGSILSGSESSYYIGNTSSYLFFHEGEEYKTTMIPMSDVKKIEFR